MPSIGRAIEIVTYSMRSIHRLEGGKRRGMVIRTVPSLATQGKERGNKSSGLKGRGGLEKRKECQMESI